MYWKNLSFGEQSIKSVCGCSGKSNCSSITNRVLYYYLSLGQIINCSLSKTFCNNHLVFSSFHNYQSQIWYSLWNSQSIWRYSFLYWSMCQKYEISWLLSFYTKNHIKNGRKLESNQNDHILKNVGKGKIKLITVNGELNELKTYWCNLYLYFLK